jgi:hypothetical protein
MLPVAVNKFIRVFNFLANMGLVIRDDPPKVIDMTGREWGDAVNGLALSVRELKREEPRQVAGISVVMKNGGAHLQQLDVPPWIVYYAIEGLELTAYGRQSLNAERKMKNTEVTLNPGDAVETDLPIATIYKIRAAGDYKVQVSCRLPDGLVLRSNEIIVRVP